jgi:hypothetical protein
MKRRERIARMLNESLRSIKRRSMGALLPQKRDPNL